MGKKRPKNIKWKTVKVRGEDAKLLRGLMGPTIDGRRARAADQDEEKIEVPDLSGISTAIEKAEFLLTAAAAIEQALMVQYLYAMYSLRTDDDREDRKRSLQAWSTGLREIAVEEMEHLMMVEIMLLLLGLPLNFTRSGIPEKLDPFNFRLEPLTRSSLAKYVITESPPAYGEKENEALVEVYEEARKLAKSETGMMINHVGILYAILAVVFHTAEELEEETEDEWDQTIRAIARCLYGTTGDSSDGWHLNDSDIKDADVGGLVLENYWQDVKLIEDRKSAIAAIREISVEGEGMGVEDREGSHFDMFFDMYREYPKPDDWRPTFNVPVDPFIDEESKDENAISDSDAVAWARLGDLQYGLILGGLQEYFYSIADEERRDKLRDYCFDGGMYALTSLAGKLVGMSRAGEPEKRASLPFSEPDEVNLPEKERRSEVLRDQLEMAMSIAQRLIDGGSDDRVLKVIIRENQIFLDLLSDEPEEQKPDGDKDGVNDQAILDLIESKTPRARIRHRRIEVELEGGGETNLRQLFRDENSDAIMEFLKTGQSVIEPFEGMALVEPGKPNESAFYLHISNDEGVMSRQFDEDEVELVKIWIESMGEEPDSTGAETSSFEAQAMLDLIKLKKPQGRAFHRSIDADEDNSLSDLFAGDDFEGVMNFLMGGEASLEPFVDKPLIVPGNPDESAFYLHLTDPEGVMAGRFQSDEVNVVRDWINSLSNKSNGASSTRRVSEAPIRVSLEEVIDGLDRPVFVCSPPGDNKRLFVVEQRGAIKVIKLNSGKLNSTAFLEISSLARGNEQGLLGLAFHPDFESNGRFFVNCTVADGTTEIRSYETKSKNQADPRSKKVILRIRQPFGNHNGGWMAFSPKDKFLYIATGDGGSGNDPHRNAQNLGSLLGKMLRIDVDGDDFPNDENRNYAIPASNPFVNVVNAQDEIWAYGLRNPWRCSFDRQTGDLYIGDVGQNAREEVNFQLASSTGGENYGWRVREGTLETGLENNLPGPFVDPVIDYQSSVDGISVIGGYVYRGSEFDSVSGTYFYGDFLGRLWSASVQPGAVITPNDHSESLDLPDGSIEDITSFGEDGDGEIYLCSLSGSIHKLSLASTAMSARQQQKIAKIKIHPAIGIARVGNAGFVAGVPTVPADPSDFFVGPEKPYQTSPPAGGYKRNGRVRRQAARFRLFGYDADDNLIGEITSEQADITWNVELANKKASFRKFAGLSTDGELRNEFVQGARREKLEIKPGTRSLDGPDKSAVFDGGKFSDFAGDTEHTVDDICLGQIQTESTGRLLVLGGDGTGGSPLGKDIGSFVNNDGWYDTMADGPVNATVILNGGKEFVAEGAWVICTPPKFAPALRNVVTLYGVLFDRFVEKEKWLSLPGRPSFRFDIFPFLETAIQLRWLISSAGRIHDIVSDAFPPADKSTREDIFKRLRHPIESKNFPGMNMPMLFDDRNGWDRDGSRGLTVTKSMYAMLEKWVSGEFENDWDGAPPIPPSEITPEGLDRAALENCSGGGFYPGIEAGWMMRDELKFIEPFRLDTTELSAGDISRQMAVPWQADYLKCSRSRGSIGWWPQQRPDDVFVEGVSSSVAWTREKIRDHQDMVNHWHELGFIVNNGTRFVETERSENAKTV